MGELGVLFNPGMRHEQEEKLAKQMLREDEGTGRKGRLGIDLESGVAVIGSVADEPSAEPEVNGSAESSTDTRPGEVAEAGNDGVADDPESDASDPAAPQAPAADRTTAARSPLPGEARPARRAVKEAPSGKAKRKASTPVPADAPVGKSRRRSH